MGNVLRFKKEVSFLSQEATGRTIVEESSQYGGVPTWMELCYIDPKRKKVEVENDGSHYNPTISFDAWLMIADDIKELKR